MLKRPITYSVNDGETTVVKTANFYFNLEVDEVAHLELDMPGGLSNYWIKLVEDKDAGKMLHAFKDLIAAAYGERDGELFLKETESGYSLGRRWLQHPAYHVLFLELLGVDSSDEAFSDFLQAIVPPELAEEMKKARGVKLPTAAPQIEENSTDEPPAERTKAEEFAREELLGMTQEEFDKVAGTDPMKMSRPVLQVAMQRKSQSQA